MNNTIKIFSELIEYVKNNNQETLVLNAFSSFFKLENTCELNIKKLTDKFDSRVYKQFTANSNYFIENIQDIKKNTARYEHIYNSLVSQKSKNTLFNLLLAILFIDNNALFNSFTLTNFDYSPDNMFSFSEDEIFIDGGAYDGYSSLEFINHVPNYSKIYLCEPIKETIKIAEKLLADNINDTSKIAFLDIALSDKKSTLSFSNDLEEGNHVQSDNNDEHSVIINTDTIDNVVGKDKITFIKLDVEGMENQVLDGAKKTIKNYTPKLAISVYHKPGDLHILFDKIESLNNGYRFELVQTCPHEFTDTILYAIPIADKDKKSTELTSKKMILTDSRKELYCSMFNHRKSLLNDVYSLYINNSEILSNNKSLVKDNSSLNLTIKNLSEENNHLNVRLTELVTYNSSLNKDVQKLSEEKSNLNVNLKNLTNDNSILSENVKKLTKDNQNLNVDVKKLTDDNSNLSENVKKLTEDNQNLDVSIHELAEENEHLSVSLVELRESNASLNSNLKELSEDNRTLNLNLKNFIKDSAKLNLKVKTVTQDNKELHNKLITIYEQLVEEISKNNNFKATEVHLHNLLNQASHDLYLASLKANDEAEKFRNEIETLKNENQNLALQIHNAHTSISFKITKPLRMVGRLLRKIFK